MHFARFAGLDYDSGFRAQALADQVMVDGGGGQQGRHRHALDRGVAIRENQNIVAVENRIGGLVADPLDGALETVDALAHRPRRVDRMGAERAVHQARDRTDFFQIGVGQDRLRDFEPIVCAGLVPQEIRPRSDHRDQRHDELLADRIDRRVGDLGEVLLEVVEQQLRLARQHGKRRVGAHRADRVVGLLGHRLEKDVQVFLGIAEHLLAVQQGGRIVGADDVARVGWVGQLFELALGVAQPLLIGVLVGELALDFVIADDAAFLEVDEQHLARLQTPLVLDVFFRNRQHAGLGGEHDVVVIGNDVARRAQTVAVECRADLAAVGEGDRGGAVPRLHQRAVIFVERTALGIHQRIAGPGLGNQHHHRVRQGVAAGDEQFERVVDAGGVGLAVRDQRPHLVEIGTQQVGGHRTAPRRHPVDVAADRVDFAVVGEKAVGMRQAPRREGVGREALMDERQRRDRERIAQVFVEAADLGGEQEALVDHRAGRERRHVELGQAGNLALRLQVSQAVQGLLADRQNLALERLLVLDLGIARDNRLADDRHGLDDARAETGEVDRDVAPAEQGLAIGLDEMLEMANHFVARLRVARHEAHGDRVMAGVG